MPLSPSRRLVRARTALAASLLAVLALVIAPGAAHAHDALVSSTPAAGSTVPILPAELTLTFSGQLLDEPTATRVEVTGPHDMAAHAGSPVVEGATVTVPLVAEAAAGAYHVAWRVVGSDGHTVSGEFSFEVLTSTLTEPSAPPSPKPTDASAEPEVPTSGSGTPLWVTVALIGLVVIVLSLAVLLRRRRDQPGWDGR